MSTSTPTPSADTTPKRFRPYQMSIALGIGIGVFTLASGIIPQFTKWHSTSTMTREVFEGIPGPLQIAFYSIIPVMLIWGAFRFADRIRNWERGAPDRRRTTTKNVKRRLADYRAGVYMRTLLRDSAAGLMHSLIYFGFLILLGVTTVLEIDHQMPESLKFLHGTVYQAYVVVGDAAGLMFTGGVVWAILRRYVQRPYRIRIKTKAEHGIILGVLYADWCEWIRGGDVPHRSTTGRWCRPLVREVEFRRLPACTVGERRVTALARRSGTKQCG